MKKIVIILLFSCVFLFGVSAKPAPVVPMCHIEQCRHECWQRNDKCKNRCVKNYNNESAGYWDCLRDCSDMSEECYKECDRHCK